MSTWNTSTSTRAISGSTPAPAPSRSWSPTAVTSDGAPRLLAVESVSAESHDAVMAFLRDMVARGLRAPLLTITDGAPGLVGAVEQVFPDSLRQRCVIHRCRTGDLATLTVYLRFPRQQWRRICHTNLIERTFDETRSRVKLIGRLPGERSCLTLAWAGLDRASRGWRGVDINPANVRLLQQLRHDLLEPRTAEDPQTEPDQHDLPDVVTPAA